MAWLGERSRRRRWVFCGEERQQEGEGALGEVEVG